MNKLNLILALFLSIFLLACEKEEDGEQKDLTSTSLSDDSHNNGENCQNCHKSGGSGDGWFTVAGSVYNSTQTVPYITASIELRTEQSGQGSLVKRIDVDQNGNFYTTDPVDFGTGLFISAVGGTSTQYMSSKTTNGACNSCHNSSKPIWAN